MNTASVLAFDKAYETGRKAAIEGQETTENPYGYFVQSALYWEWMRGYREYMFPEPHEQMNLLIRRAFVQKDRRFHPEPTPLTGFGDNL